MAHDDWGSNYLAYLALVIWPVVTVYLYSKFPIAQATLWAFLSAFLLLPVRTDFHFHGLGVNFDKRSIASLSAVIGCTLVAGRPLKIFRGFGLVEILVLIIILDPFVSAMLNGDPINNGRIHLPSVGFKDGGNAAISQFILLLPFFIGRHFLRSSKDNVEILRVLTIAGLVYSLPMLWEIRMSPQLHNWLYGYLPFGFAAESRYGGFRPMVFIGNGLLVAFFVMTTTVAATALSRLRIRAISVPPGAVTGYLGFVLLLCKTLSALLYALVLVPLVRWASPRLQVRAACVLVLIALGYPMLRTADLVPTTTLVNAARMVSEQRADSLQFRFDQEKRLLDRAMERPWFGWGRYGRNRIYSPESGRDVSISDGFWVALLGSSGLVAFSAVFGLFAIVVFRAAKALKFVPTINEQIAVATLTLIIAINVINLVPNSSMSPWSWLLVGALLGRAESLYATARQRVLSDTLQPSPLPPQPNTGDQVPARF